MKKILALVVLVLIVALIVVRHRLYLRDPLGSVTRNGVAESGAQVYFNVDNDVLLENDNPPVYVFVVQHPDHLGAPLHLACAHWMGCLLDADQPKLDPVPGAKPGTFTSRTVTFTDPEGRQAIVKLY